MRYTEKEYRIIAENMIAYGGSFFRAIGEALQRADRENTIKLETVFEEEFKKYLKL